VRLRDRRLHEESTDPNRRLHKIRESTIQPAHSELRGLSGLKLDPDGASTVRLLQQLNGRDVPKPYEAVHQIARADI